MKFLLLLLTLFSTQLFARGFVETQFQYAKNINGQNHFSIEWNESEKLVEINMKLKLTNYRVDWHKGGFKLDKAHSAYISFPEMNDECRLEHPKSRIPDYDTTPDAITKIKIRLHGEDCKELMEYYKLYGVVISFYKVPSLADVEVTQVVRLYIVDTP